jgi:tRNA nucleotidyltransferase (CCA-adding enzyme)
VHNHRLRDELVLFFKEKDSWKPLRRLSRLAGYGYISADLRLDVSYRRKCQKADVDWVWFCRSFPHRRIPELYQIRMILFFSALSLAQMIRVTAAYAFYKRENAGLLDFAAHAGKTIGVLSRVRLRPSQVYRCLEPLSYETILAIRALSPDKRLHDRIERYLRHYDGQRNILRGDDLSAMGLVSGPRFKRVLDQLLEARLDGKVVTKEQEMEWARRFIAASQKNVRQGKGD